MIDKFDSSGTYIGQLTGFDGRKILGVAGSIRAGMWPGWTPIPGKRNCEKIDNFTNALDNGYV